MNFSTKNFARRETGWYLTHAVIGRGDHPNIGPRVCDGLILAHTAMKHHLGMNCLQLYFFALIDLLMTIKIQA